MTKEQLEARLKQLQQQHGEAIARVNMIVGAIQNTVELLEQWDTGATAPPPASLEDANGGTNPS